VLVEYVGERCKDALSHLFVCFAAVGASSFSAQPLRERASESSVDLRASEPFPMPEVDLSEARVGHDAEAMPLCQDQRRLIRALRVATVHGVNGVNLSGEVDGLLATRLVQGWAGMALPAMIAVPVGLAVAR
jgi:hypothetical protein